MAHADKHRILHPPQHGFRKDLSCDTQLVEFVDDVTKNLDSGKQTDCLIMDFSKAFDKVCRSLISLRLGFRRNFLSVLHPNLVSTPGRFALCLFAPESESNRPT